MVWVARGSFGIQQHPAAPFEQHLVCAVGFVHIESQFEPMVGKLRQCREFAKFVHAQTEVLALERQRAVAAAPASYGGEAIAGGNWIPLPVVQLHRRPRGNPFDPAIRNAASFLAYVLPDRGESMVSAKNVMQAKLAPHLAKAGIDIDPGFGQMWRQLGLHDVFRGHHRFATIGENIGQEGCGVPDCGIEWIPTRPPVQLDYWQRYPIPPGDSFTTVGSWRGSYGPLSFQGKNFGLRVHEFRKFAALPQLTHHRFELALDMHKADGADKMLLERSGW